MTEFLVFAALLVAASLVFVLLPLWRAGRPVAHRRRDANITIYHQRYAEIEREVAAGRLGRREAEVEKDELGARLLSDLDETPALAPDASVRRRPWVLTLLVVILVVGLSSGGYWLRGDWGAMQTGDRPDLPAMMGELQQRIDESPDDLEARALLARAQESTGDYAGAAENYGALNAAMPQPQPALLAAEARARLQATDDLQGRANDLYRQVLELDPASLEALWYLGLAAAERGDDARAVSYWDRLLAEEPPAEFRDMVETRRAELVGDKPQLQGD